MLGILAFLAASQPKTRKQYITLWNIICAYPNGIWMAEQYFKLHENNT